jgi:hypothetical protein
MTARRFLTSVGIGIAAAAVLLVLADALDAPTLAVVGAVIVISLLVVRDFFAHRGSPADDASRVRHPWDA